MLAKGGGGPRHGFDPAPITFVTYNGTSWPAQLALLRRAAAGEFAGDCFFFQEHHLHDESQILAATRSISSLGYIGHFTRAVLLPSGLSSGGVAVVVRSSFGLVLHPSDRMIPDDLRHRLIFAELQVASAGGSLFICSAYFQAAAGMNATNATLLSMIGQALPADLQVLLCGDWNMPPTSLSDFCAETGLEVRSSEDGTCRSSAGTYSTIDYMMISPGLAALSASIAETIPDDFRPHRPVTLTLPTGFGGEVFRVWETPPSWKTARVVGAPRRPAAVFSTLVGRSRRLLELAASEHDQEVMRQLSSIYSQWMKAVDEELADLTGTAEAQGSRRSTKRVPRLLWKSALQLPRAKVVASSSTYRHCKATWQQYELAAQHLAKGAFAQARHAGQKAEDMLDGVLAMVDGDDPVHEAAAEMHYAWLEYFQAVSSNGTAGGYERHDGSRSVRAADGGPPHAGEPHPGGGGDEHFGHWPSESLHGASLAFQRALGSLVGCCCGMEQADLKANRAVWQQWADDAMAGGARVAHQVTRGGAGWRPTPVEVQEGDGEVRLSSHPANVLAAAVNKWAEVWGADPAGSSCESPLPIPPPVIPARGFGTQRPPPSLRAGDLRRAASTFGIRTAVQLDGLRLKQLSWLSAQALEALAAMFDVTSVTGVFPRQVCRVLAPMLPKKAGGHRLIGLFPAYYRLWSRTVVGQVRDWEAAIDQPWMAASKGRQPTDSVWRSEVRAEQCKCRGEFAACISMDISAFYEHVSHEKLASFAVGLGFPIGPLRAALRAYKWPRFVQHCRMVGPALSPTRGIVAGCTFATSLVKAYYFTGFSSLQRLWLEARLAVDLDVYLDDITVAARSSSPTELTSTMIEAGCGVVQVVEQLECSVAPAKTAVAASSRAVAYRLAARFLGHEAAVRQHDAYGLLGCEVRQAGRWKHRQAPRRTRLRAKRLQAAADRFRRSGVFRRLCGLRASSLFVAGVRSVADFGAEVTGINNEVVDRLSIWAARFWARTQRSSRTAWMVLQGDPTLRPATAAARRWAQEIWNANVDSRAFSLPHMQEIFTTTAVSRGVTRWNFSRGPISVAALELRRLGWSWPAADRFVDELGEEVYLREVSPARLMAWMATSRSRQLILALGRKAGVPYGVDLGPAKALLSSSRLEARDKAIVRQLVTDSIWTCADLARHGYPVTPMCPMCGREPDTLKHRIWQCTHPEVARVRTEVSTPELTAAACDMPEHACCHTWTRPITWNHPPPIPGTWSEQAVWQENAGGEGEEACWVPSDPGSWMLTPDMACFTDGSCNRPSWRGGDRAGWGMVIMQGCLPLYRGLGPVVRSWAQSAPAGEWLAVAAAASVWPPDFPPPRCDCLGVVRATHQQPGLVVRKGGFWAGALKQAISTPNLQGRIWPLVKIKAHRVVTAETDPHESAEILGNDLADAAAKAGATAHGQLAAGEIRCAEHSWSEQTAMLKVAAKVLALFPTLASGFRGRLSRGPQACRPARPPPPPRPPPVPVERAHRFGAFGGHILCDFCLARAASWQSAAKRSRSEVCPRACDEMTRAIEAQDLGHRLCLVSYKGVPSVVCVTCGARCTTRREGLVAPCPGATKHGRETFSRIRRGFHPDTRKKTPLEAVFKVEGTLLTLVG